MFEPLQQKDISGVVQVLWHADQYKAIWQVIAKAYSIIRDVKGKENAPLNTFLELAAPFAGIIAPGNYFIALGWKLLIDHEGQVMLSKDQVYDIGNSCANIPGLTVSVVDVIMHCVGTGYATMENYDLALTTNEQSMMALTIPNTAEVSDDRLGGDASQVNTTTSTNVADHTGLEPWEYNMAVDLQEGIALLNAQSKLIHEFN
jgi:Mating-type protein MAT alpha 1 HMG-box